MVAIREEFRVASAPVQCRSNVIPTQGARAITCNRFMLLINDAPP